MRSGRSRSAPTCWPSLRVGDLARPGHRDLQAAVALPRAVAVRADTRRDGRRKRRVSHRRRRRRPIASAPSTASAAPRPSPPPAWHAQSNSPSLARPCPRRPRHRRARPSGSSAAWSARAVEAHVGAPSARGRRAHAAGDRRALAIPRTRPRGRAPRPRLARAKPSVSNRTSGAYSRWPSASRTIASASAAGPQPSAQASHGS